MKPKAVANMTCKHIIEDKVKNLAEYYYERYKEARTEFMACSPDKPGRRRIHREEMLTWKEAIERMVFLKLINSEDYRL